MDCPRDVRTRTDVSSGSERNTYARNARDVVRYKRQRRDVQNPSSTHVPCPSTGNHRQHFPCASNLRHSRSLLGKDFRRHGEHASSGVGGGDPVENGQRLALVTLSRCGPSSSLSLAAARRTSYSADATLLFPTLRTLIRHHNQRRHAPPRPRPRKQGGHEGRRAGLGAGLVG